MKKTLIFLIVWALIFWYFQYKGYQDFLVQEIAIENNTLEIPKDTTPRAYFINELGLNENYVKIYFKLNNLNPKFEAGSFSVDEPITVQNFFDKLDKPIIEWDINFVLKEWQNIYDIDACLSNPREFNRLQNGTSACLFDTQWWMFDSIIQSGDFTQYAQSQSTVETLKSDFPFLIWALSLEWFLYPDTYKINKNTYSHEILARKMLQNFDKKIMQDKELIAKFWDRLAKEVANNINIASIVEREIASPANREDDEAEKVAGVLKKRYEENWQIWADATVCYPYGIPSAECTPSFVLEKLYDITDYNTRQMTWLPKTPISNPYIGTIKSTLLSQESKYYFYLHAPDGKIYYAETNAQHESNKSRYLR